MWRYSIVLAVALAGPASAGERVNQEQVGACLDQAAERGAPVETCVATVLYPCERMLAQNAARACFYRLRERWHAEIGRLGYAGQGTVARLEGARSADRRQPGTCGGPAFAAALEAALGGPADIWTADNACAVFRAALAWHRLAD